MLDHIPTIRHKGETYYKAKDVYKTLGYSINYWSPAVRKMPNSYKYKSGETRNDPWFISIKGIQYAMNNAMGRDFPHELEKAVSTIIHAKKSEEFSEESQRQKNIDLAEKIANEKIEMAKEKMSKEFSEKLELETAKIKKELLSEMPFIAAKQDLTDQEVGVIIRFLGHIKDQKEG